MLRTLCFIARERKRERRDKMVGSGSINSKLKAGKSDEETQRRLKKMERDGSLGFEVT